MWYVQFWGFPGGTVVKNPPANSGDIRDKGSISGSGRSPRGGHGNPLQYSCLENPMDRGVWRATVHKVAKSWTRLMWLSTAHGTCLVFNGIINKMMLMYKRETQHCKTIILQLKKKREGEMKGREVWASSVEWSGLHFCYELKGSGSLAIYIYIYRQSNKS